MPDTFLVNRMRICDLPVNGVLYVDPYCIRVNENRETWVMKNAWGYVEPIGPYSMRIQNTSDGYSVDILRKCKYAPHFFSQYEKENTVPVSKIASHWEISSPLYPEFPNFY